MGRCLRQALPTLVALALIAGCGGEADDPSAGATTVAPATTTAPEPPATTAAEEEVASGETMWLATAEVDKLLSDIEEHYDRLKRTGEIRFEADIESIGGSGPGPCRRTLEGAGKPPARLKAVYDLTRRACVQVERATDQMLSYTVFDEKTGASTVHQSDPRAAEASLTRANKLAAQARKALKKLGL